MSKLQTRNAFSNTSLQDTDLFWIDVDMGSGVFQSQKITGLQLKTILSQDPIVNDVVFIDKNTPTTSGVTFDPNTPTTQDILYISTTNGSTWIYNGSTYVTYTMPTTSSSNFYLSNTSTDAGSNKTASIERSGDIRVRSGSNQIALSHSVGLSVDNNGYSQIIESSYSDTLFPIFRQTRKRGTKTTQTNVQNGDTLGYIAGGATYDSVILETKATENHSTGVAGSELIVKTTPNGASTAVEVAKFTQDGKLKLGNAFSLPKVDGTSNQVLQTNGAGVVSWATPATGGLTYFTEAQNTSAPNATVNVDSLTAVGSSTNVDFAIKPKGTGAILAAIPDSTATGGNKRGANAVDLQTDRTLASEVSSGGYSVNLGGSRNTSSGGYSVNIGGYLNTSSGNYAIAGGYNNTSNSSYSVALGGSNTASNTGAVALGNSNIVSGVAGFGSGSLNINSGNYSAVFGYSNSISGAFTIRAGYGNTGNGAYSITSGYNNAVSGSENGCFGSSSTVSADYAFSLGYGNTANSINSLAIGKDANTFSIINKFSFGTTRFTSNGDNQLGELILSASTTGNTATTLTVDRNTAGTTNQLILQNQQLIRFKGTISGKQQTSTNCAVWDIDGVIVRGANAGTTTLVVNNVNLVTNASGWGIPTLTADTTNGGLQVQVTGLAATNIKWNCRIDTIELINA